MWLLGWVLACGGEEAPIAEAEPPDDVIKAGRDALHAAGVQRIRWGMTAFRDPETAQERWAPVWEHASRELGVEIELVELEAYEGVEAAMRRGEIDGATFRPWAYVAAREEMPLRLVCTHVVDGSADYGAYVIMLEDQAVRDVESLADLGGAPLGFVHPKSTSGFIFPAAMLLDAGVHPLDDVEARWYGSHEGVFDAVANGKVMAGAVYSEELDASQLRMPGAPSMRVVAKSGRIPYSAYVLREGLPPEAADALASILNQVSTQTAEGRVALRGLPEINGFLPVADSHYDGVRQAAASLRAAEITSADVDLRSGG